jgi:hypothetical protein
MIKALGVIGLGAGLALSSSLKRGMARVRILIRIRASSVIGTGTTRARIAHAKGRSGGVVIGDGKPPRPRFPMTVS